MTLFLATFSTLLAIINSLEVLPIYLKLLAGKDSATHRAVAVPLAMVRIVGGIILMRIGFSLFMPRNSGGDGFGGQADANIAFVPLAMPLMFGPGAIATIVGMASTVKDSSASGASHRLSGSPRPCQFLLRCVRPVTWSTIA